MRGSSSNAGCERRGHGHGEDLPFTDIGYYNTQAAAFERGVQRARGMPANAAATVLQTAWGLDDTIVEDMWVVFRFAVTHRNYPDTLGFGSRFGAVFVPGDRN